MCKRCRRCGVTKELGEFYKDERGRDGLRSACKACCRECSRAHYKENRDKRRAYNKAYYKENRDKRRAYSKAHYKENRDKYRAYNKAYYKENRDKHRAYVKACDLRRKYGITPEERDVMAEAQGRRCAICRRRRALCVDHCHTSGKVRGLLCRTCNTGIGHLDDNPDLTAAATTYLRTR